MHAIPLKTVGIVLGRSPVDGRLHPASACRKLLLKMDLVVRVVLVVRVARVILAPYLL
jgi:hypothetical protein